MTGVVDYQAGNLRSVETALRHLGADFIVSGSPEVLMQAEKLIFPGVGEARASMDVLRSTGLGDLILEFAASGKLLLGICIGAQILLQRSEEGDTECLGAIKGTVRRFPSDSGLKVPHMGWNQVTPLIKHPLFNGIPDETSFYFVHSYYPEVKESGNALCKTDYGITFTSGIYKENVMAVQFHPEKSGEPGLRLLNNFLEMRV